MSHFQCTVYWQLYRSKFLLSLCSVHLIPTAICACVSTLKFSYCHSIVISKTKLNFVIEQPTKAQKGSRYTARWGGFSATPRPLYLRKKNHCIGGCFVRCGRTLKLSPPPGFDLRTVKPLANRYIDWANPAHGPALRVTEGWGYRISR
jgi:hypothetical protein